jgi:hypothetical protein
MTALRRKREDCGNVVTTFMYPSEAAFVQVEPFSFYATAMRDLKVPYINDPQQHPIKMYLL